MSHIPPLDPNVAARKGFRESEERLKRFWTAVDVAEGEGGWSVTLDGRTPKTPAHAKLTLPTESAARLVAGEWAAQGAFIDPGTMPAGDVYGARGALLTTDDIEAPARFPAPAYACAKLAAEAEVRTLSRARGVHVTVLRPSMVYGPSIDSALESVLRLAGLLAPVFAGPDDRWLDQNHYFALGAGVLLIAEQAG